ncbi:MAG: DUF58 domain-containing protein [Hydrococcus sp. C42_A2020_068]|uniref:DUF58 domain-containing protein n=1 Tax=Pleurocapsa sp. PCC 7327 TaxID=118163 RepID=UPI00029FCF5B|nr:DUF58 domain-containing protein [Pleurocapsa sp. PCC 7327]AFY78780.1 hypothetical protein Ple7327_3580 [Pleurocapsa sp. PCC 7327]MBF2020195.1 DUF58 domain-containing protein [Hydrococcus sp. C42_A2020_068]
MKFTVALAEWLETHWVAPAHSGWVLAGLAACFFGAATNTMAGWLYVLSGTILAVLGLAAILPLRSLRHLNIRRLPMTPISAGDILTVELEIENTSKAAKTLLQLQDLLPYVLFQPMGTAVEVIPPKSVYRWVYYVTAKRRGVYRWHEVQLRTGTPLGLFWSRRTQEVPAKAIVYPQVLPLANCPLVDSLGQDERIEFQSDRRYQAATEGVTRALRPYRYGDPTRLIHWRISARFDEFVVRELEVITGGQEIVIALDSAAQWEEDNFESAVIAAASLYFYASRCQLAVTLWTAGTGLVRGNRVVLETLAAVEAQAKAREIQRPTLPLIWLTQNASTLDSLPVSSRWVFFPASSEDSDRGSPLSNFSGLVINPEQPLQPQLQKPLRSL